MRGLSLNTYNDVGAVFHQSNGLPIEFPIWSEFGDRVGHTLYFKDGNPKYAHSFEERGLLYNAQVLPSLFYGKPVVIVEGIFDALSLHEAGIPAVAILSNTIKKRQFLTIRRYTNKAVFWLDSDQDGEAGYQRSVKKIKKIDPQFKHIRFVNNLAKDPNDLLVKDKDLFTETIKKLRLSIKFLEA